MLMNPQLTTYVNLCWVFGQLVAAGVLRGFLQRSDQWAYRMYVDYNPQLSPWTNINPPAHLPFNGFGRFPS